MTPWETLGVARDVAVADLRRRYAALIKEFRPETHPQDFARIREAYEVVLPFARRHEAAEVEASAAREAAQPVVEDIAPADETPVDPSSPGPAESPVDHDHEIAVADAAIAGGSTPPGRRRRCRPRWPRASAASTRGRAAAGSATRPTCRAARPAAGAHAARRWTTARRWSSR